MIIVEIGLNHLGQEEYASMLAEAAASAKADAVTFQIREKAFYEEREDLKLSQDYYCSVAGKLRARGLQVGFAVCEPSFRDAIGTVKADFYKVLSWAIIDEVLLEQLMGENVPVYLSTGMSDYDELDKVYEKQKKNRRNLSLIHTQLCFDRTAVNLSAILAMKQRYGLPVGYGHHCDDLNVLPLSVAFQPDSIFIYTKGNKTVEHPDERHAIPANNLKEFVGLLRELPQAVGTPVKLKMQNLVEKI